MMKMSTTELISRRSQLPMLVDQEAITLTRYDQPVAVLVHPREWKIAQAAIEFSGNEMRKREGEE